MAKRRRGEELEKKIIKENPASHTGTWLRRRRYTINIIIYSIYVYPSYIFSGFFIRFFFLFFFVSLFLFIFFYFFRFTRRPRARNSNNGGRRWQWPRCTTMIDFNLQYFFLRVRYAGFFYFCSIVYFIYLLYFLDFVSPSHRLFRGQTIVNRQPRFRPEIAYLDVQTEKINGQKPHKT